MLENNNSGLVQINNTIVIPGSSTDTSGYNLMSHDFDDGIKAEYIERANIKKSGSYIKPNYMIDFSAVDSVKSHQLDALESMLTDDGDVALYIRLKDSVIFIGMAIYHKISKIILIGMKSVFGEACDVYEDYEPGGELRSLGESDIRSIRLNL